MEIAGNKDGNFNEDDNFFPDVDGSIDGIKTQAIVKKPDNKIETYVTHMPEFIGGNEKINPFISKNVNYPSDAINEGMDAKVWVGFVVEKDGSISNIKILECNEKGYGFENEAMRVIRIMPRWKPGMQHGYPARVYFNLPISFVLR